MQHSPAFISTITVSIPPVVGGSLFITNRPCDTLRGHRTLEKSHMRIILASLVLGLGLVGCSSSQDVSAGAVGTKSDCCANSKDCSAECKAACEAKKAEASPGAVGEKSECSKQCPMSGKTEVAPGAVGTQSECQKQCPAGKSSSEVAPGAVGEKKSGCCGSKSNISG